MHNNKTYNTRNSGRFANASNFVSAGVMAPAAALYDQPAPYTTQNQQQSVGATPRRLRPQQQPPQVQPAQHNSPIKEDDVDMQPTEPADDSLTSKNEDRPAWMKAKLAGVKKISNKERRRRQNETLRRLLTPKNALMVLNEMMPNEQIANQFKVEAANGQYYARNQHSFCADLTVDGGTYKGYGDNKLSARNQAAEQAIRDLIIKKMNKLVTADGGSQNGEETCEEEALPMIQLASFALHKLFTEWEFDGHKVPQLRPTTTSVSEAGAAVSEAPAEEMDSQSQPKKKPKGGKKPHTLPVNAPAMHPCMLLTYMKPKLEYRELAAEGDKPQNMLFTMGVDVDGATYIGKASNKKEARKAAARAACTALFSVQFDANATSATPQH